MKYGNAVHFMYCPFKNLCVLETTPRDQWRPPKLWASLGMGKTGWEVGGAWCALYNC